MIVVTTLVLYFLQVKFRLGPIPFIIPLPAQSDNPHSQPPTTRCYFHPLTLLTLIPATLYYYQISKSKCRERQQKKRHQTPDSKLKSQPITHTPHINTSLVPTITIQRTPSPSTLSDTLERSVEWRFRCFSPSSEGPTLGS